MNNNVHKRTIRPIGAYIADSFPDARHAIDKALDAQSRLEQQGLYRPLGNILAGFPEIEHQALEECLRSQRADILKAVDIFSSLPAETLNELSAALTTTVLPPGAVLFRQGAPAEAFYVVVSGAVRIVRSDAEGTSIMLDRRGPGQGLGEIAILTSGTHSSSAETIERTSFLAIPKDLFLATLFTHPTSALLVARTLAQRLSQGYGRIMEAAAAEQSFRQFIVDQLRRDEPLLIGNSPAVMKLVAEIERLSGSCEPVLVSGEPGTELKDAAGLIHDMGRDGEGMQLFFDAKACSGDASANSDDPLFRELSQSGALFGRGRNAVPFAPDRQPGLLTMAAGGTVVIENIEFLVPRIQERLASYLADGLYTAIGEPGAMRSDARIIATTSADLGVLAASGAFHQKLEQLLSRHPLAVPPLRRRKKDLSIIVEELIRRNDRVLGKNVTGIDEEAYHSLVNYDWPGNTEELRVVIRRAVSIAQGAVLTSEDIFIGPPPVTGKYALDLLSFEPVRKLFRSRFYPRAAHFVTIPFIALIAGFGIFGPQAPDRNLALILTWGLWEPTLVLSALFAGRMWCSVCPIGAVSGLVRSIAGRNLKVPSWIRNRGFYLTAAGIAAIFWLEAVFDMPSSPRATALLVIPLVLLAGLAGLLFQRRTWCRYICPLGGMMGVFASTSVIEMRSNYGICNSTCLKHECYAGTEDREGCPMFEGPFALTSNRTCALCGNCVKICPNHSPVLNLRLPGYELWTVHTPDRAFATITIALLGTQLFRGMEKAGIFESLRSDALSWWGGTLALLVGSVFAAWSFARLAGSAAFGTQQQNGKPTNLRIAYVLLPLVFTFEAGFHLERFLTLAGQFFAVLGRQLGLASELPGYSVPSQVIAFFQALLVAAGTAGAAGILAKMEQSSFDHRFLRRSWPLLCLSLVYLAIFLAN